MLKVILSILAVVLSIDITAAHANDIATSNSPAPIPTDFTFVYPDVVKQLQHMKIPTDIDEQGLEDLYHRYYQHYKDFLGSNPKKEVTYDWLMDEKNARISFELNYLFSLALERKLDVSRFAVFGLHTKPNGNVRFDYRESKYLIPVFDLHDMLLYPDVFDAWLVKLLDMGLTSSELELLKSYGRAMTHNHKLSNTINSLLYQYKVSIADSMKYAVKHKHTLKPEKFRYLLSREKFAIAYIKYTIKRHAGIQLFKQLTSRQQRILKVFLIEQNRNVGSYGTVDYEQELLKRIHAVETGQWYEQLKSRMQSLKMQEAW